MDVMRAGARPGDGSHRIVTARMLWVIQRARRFYRQPRAVKRPEFPGPPAKRNWNTRGCAAARAQKRAHEPLVSENQACDGAAHCSVTFFHSEARLARSSSEVKASRARSRALTTRSTGGSLRVGATEMTREWCDEDDCARPSCGVLDRNGQSQARSTNAARSRSHEESITKAPSARVGVASKSDLRRRRRCAGSVSRPRIVLLR